MGRGGSRGGRGQLVFFRKITENRGPKDHEEDRKFFGPQTSFSDKRGELGIEKTDCPVHDRVNGHRTVKLGTGIDITDEQALAHHASSHNKNFNDVFGYSDNLNS